MFLQETILDLEKFGFTGQTLVLQKQTGSNPATNWQRFTYQAENPCSNHAEPPAPSSHLALC